MYRCSRLSVLVLLSVIGLSCRSEGNGTPGEAVFSLPELGLRYSPPEGMTDKTSADAKKARTSAGSYSGHVAELLLDLSSDDNDTSADWHQIWVFIYPRALLPKLDDSVAEEKMNAALAGRNATPFGQAQSIVLSGHAFMVSEFQKKEPPLTKDAKVLTTICKSELVSFVLVSNSTSWVNKMQDSLKTLNFSTP
jgi:hypothetical protein